MIIDFNTYKNQLFNPIFFKIQKAKTRFVVVYGGASSGKSFAAHQLEIIKLLDNPTHDTLFIRKHASDIYDSCYMLLKNISTEWGVQNYFKWAYSSSKREILNIHTKKRVLFRGVDDADKLKSIAGIKRVLIEEADQLTQKDFLELNRRVRGVKDIQFIIIFNPVLETHWLKKYFFDNERIANDTTHIHATYKDNLKFLTEDDIKHLEGLKYISPNEYNIYTKGLWGKPDVQRPYCINFNRDKHVSEVAIYQQGKRLYFSLDFNVDPFVCLVGHIWNDKNGQHWHIFREIVLTNGSVPQMIDIIKQSYSRMELSNCVFTGDAMQKKREIIEKNNASAWIMIDKAFNLGRRLQVPNANPRVKDNRHLINALHARHPDLKIHPECTTLINECQYTEVDEEGNILKKDRNKINQRADALDAKRYMANTWLIDFMINERKYLKR